MSQANIHLTPEEIENFARVLEQFVSDLSNSTSTLNANLTQLGDTWRDPAFAEFEAQFAEARRNIESFIKIGEEHTAYLKRKAHASYLARDQR